MICLYSEWWIEVKISLHSITVKHTSDKHILWENIVNIIWTLNSFVTVCEGAGKHEVLSVFRLTSAVCLICYEGLPAGNHTRRIAYTQTEQKLTRPRHQHTNTPKTRREPNISIITPLKQPIMLINQRIFILRLSASVTSCVWRLNSQLLEW